MNSENIIINIQSIEFDNTNKKINKTVTKTQRMLFICAECKQSRFLNGAAKNSINALAELFV